MIALVTLSAVRSRGLRTPVACLLLALCVASRRCAKIEIEIPDVTEPIENNVRAFLSLTRYAERDDITPEVMSRLQRRIVTETREALEPLGYYEPEVSYEVDPGGRRCGESRSRDQPGRPVRLSEVDIDVQRTRRERARAARNASTRRRSSRACA